MEPVWTSLPQDRRHVARFVGALLPRVGVLRVGVTVAVVETVGDVEAVRQHLAGLYSYNLCVTKVDYSRSALDTVQAQLLASVSREQWFATIDVGWNRVHLRLLVLDAEPAQLLEPDADRIELDSLVQKVVP